MTPAELLRRLPDEGFCPPEEWVRQSGGSVSTDAQAAAEAATAADVDDFASRYWTLPPAERRAEWKELLTRPADPPTTAFLARLGLALKVQPAAHDDPAVAELSAVAQELHALRPRPRAVRRAAWLDAKSWNVVWPEVAARLKEADAPTADLDPPLLAALTTTNPAPTSVEAGSPPTQAPPQEVAYRPRRREAAAPTAASEESGGGFNWNWLRGGGILVAVLIGVVRACSGCGGSTSTTPPPAYQYNYTPSYPTGGYQPTSGGYTTLEVATFRLHESRPSSKPPARYSEWVSDGRPNGGPLSGRKLPSPSTSPGR